METSLAVEEEEDSDSIIDYGDNLVDIPSNHWIFKRGFTKSILDKWDCKVNSYNDLVIPIKAKDGTTSGWVTRRIQATPKYMYSKGLKKSKLLYGINHLQSVGTLHIVEGTLDAMWMDYHGYPTVAILDIGFFSATSVTNPFSLTLAKLHLG